VPDLNAENSLMQAWFSSLTTADGVDMVSETRIRLLRIADRGRFQQALQRLRAAYDWRAEFRAANPGPSALSVPSGEEGEVTIGETTTDQ
jgi:hypothetical protein